MASNWQQLKKKLEETEGASAGKRSKLSAKLASTATSSAPDAALSLPGAAQPAHKSSNAGKRRRLDLNEAVLRQQGQSLGESGEQKDRDGEGRGAKRHKSGPADSPPDAAACLVKFSHAHLGPKAKAKYVGLDCEMVGTGFGGKQSLLARCCLVDFDGQVTYDSFVKPQGFVTDFRTQWSGVRAKDLFGKQQENIVTFAECQAHVAAALRGKVLLGHGLKNDLDALQLSHPRNLTRDTARYKPYMRKHRADKYRPRALRELSKDYLKKTIQTGEHDPGEDARAAVHLYRLKMDEWEAEIRNKRAASKGGGEKEKGGGGELAGEGFEGANGAARAVSAAPKAPSTWAKKRPAASAVPSSMFGASAGEAGRAGGKKIRSVGDVDRVRGLRQGQVGT